MFAFPRVAGFRALLAVLATAAAAACAGCGAASAPSNAPQGSAPVTILQDSVHVLLDPAGTLDVLRSLGVREVRIFMPWGTFAPNPGSHTPPPGFHGGDPAAYPAAPWAPYDAAVRAAAARGIGVYLLLTGPAPLWATSAPPHGVTTHNPSVYEPSAARFGAFVRAVGTRYGGSYTPSGSSSPLPKVSFWGIWNEPNYGPDLQPQAIHGVEISPAVYRGLLGSAWTALHATGHGIDTILFGETAARGGNVPAITNGMVPLRFLRALYCVDSSLHELRGSAATARGCPATAAGSSQFRAHNPALFQASGYAAHPYTLGQVAPPDQPTPANEPDYAGLVDLAKLEQTLDRLNAIYGSHTRFPIYNTEFGFQTNPPTPKCGCVFISPAIAAYYLNWSEYLMWKDPRVRSDAQYLLYDGAIPGHLNESSFATGLRFVTGAPKADYAAFLLPLYLPLTSTRHGQPLEVWGHVRAGPFATRDTGSLPRVLIQFQRASRGAWTTLRTVTISNPAGYFAVPVAFPASGSVRLVWTYPSKFAFLPAATPATVTSRIQKITVS